ncbi:elongation factor P 5-aminopentanone reductase [Sutcliffiella deserti]|uniref:elongation factor P 5-aminopentanone reductase n=1 Tax=Sutcliffiella deserti TaxID=2875501 RepID=UPI001CBBB3DD|nr:SDR family oxidoreductase [Sutcliffiella deserti]
MKKTALIIGASGDIGSAIATNLIENGYFTYLHYHRDITTIQKFENKYGSENIVKIQADLSDTKGVKILQDTITRNIDTLIYTAGTSFYGLMTEIEEEAKQNMIQLNVTSLYSAIQAFLPSMVTNKTGNIVVISSIWGEIGASCEVLYSMVKGAQISFVKALAKEVAPSGIRVNAVAPGAVQTKMLHHFTEEEKKSIAEEIPMGRFASPKEIAETVSFLISSKASYTTGQILGVNGGWN